MYGKIVEVGPKLKDMIGENGSYLSSGDTPGVRVLGAVQQAALQQEMAIRYLHDLFEIWVRNGDFTKEKSDDLTKVLRANRETQLNELGLITYRDHLRIYFEELIWILILWENLKPGPISGIATNDPVIPGATKELIAYMTKRLIHIPSGLSFDEYIKSPRRGVIYSESKYNHYLAADKMCQCLYEIKQKIIKDNGLLHNLVPHHKNSILQVKA